MSHMKAAVIILVLVAVGLAVAHQTGYVDLNLQAFFGKQTPSSTPTTQRKSELDENNPCKPVSETEARDDCYRRLAEDLSKTSPQTAFEACERIRNHGKRVACIKKVSDITGNIISKCELESSVFEKHRCLLDEARDAAESDPIEAEKLCDLIENPLRLTWCYTAIVEVIVAYDTTEAAAVCERIDDDYSQSECYMKVAVVLAKTSDRNVGVGVCDRMNDADKSNYCKARVYYFTDLKKAKEYCNNIKDDSNRMACTTYVEWKRD